VAGAIAAEGCTKQSTDANDAARAVRSTDPNDATSAEPDGHAPASAADDASARPALIGDARMNCADAAKELRFIETHKSCKVDQDCSLVDTWLYPCGMSIQKSAIPDLKAVDLSVSTACAKLGFSAPPPNCTGPAPRGWAACSLGSCGMVSPVPLEQQTR
jgi:hypothetical protein